MNKMTSMSKFAMRREAEHWVISKFKADAVADGWEITPTYEHESVDRAATLIRDGYMMAVITRDSGVEGHDFRHSSNLTIWCPRGIGVNWDLPYSWDMIVAKSEVCDVCKRPADKTYRVAFANRSCETCLPVARKKWEPAGWYN